MLDTTRAEVNSESETTQNIDKTKINFNFNLLNQTINTKLPKQAKLQDNEMHDKNQENETPGRRGPSSGFFWPRMTPVTVKVLELSPFASSSLQAMTHSGEKSGNDWQFPATIPHRV